MSRFNEFITTVTTSLNPKKYDLLEIRPLGAAVGYFFAMVFAAFALMAVLWLPNALTLGDYIGEQFDRFEELTIEVVYDQKEPIVITKDYPLITIDTMHPYDDIEQGILLITENKTFYRPLPFMESSVIEDTENLAETNDQTTAFLTIAVLMMLPAMLAFAYAYFAIKYLLIALVATVLGYIFIGLIRFQISFEQLFKTALYASTIMVLIGLLTKPFIPDIAYLDYLAFAVVYVLGIIKVGEFEEIIREKKHKKEFAD